MPNGVIRQEIEREVAATTILVNGTREELSRATNWPTLPKVFIGGTVYGDTDVLEPMAQSGELQAVLADAFAGMVEPAPVVHLPELARTLRR